MHTSTDVFAKVRDHERSELLAAARAADILPYFHVLTSPAMPVVEMEGAERIMLGSNNYLGLTGDERVMQGAEDALHRFGTGLTGSRLLNGTIPLHLQLEREIAEWMNCEDAIVFTTGHQANIGTLGTLLGPADTVDRRLRRPRLDPRRLPALARQAAAVSPQPPGQAGEDAPARAGRRRRHPRGRRRRVLDGGRHRPVGRHLRPVRALRRAPDGRRGAWRRRAGAHGAGTAELLGVADRVDLRMGTFSKSLASCGGFVAGSHEVIEYLRLYSRAFLFTASAVPAAVGAAAAALRVLRSDDGPPLLARVLENARMLRDGLEQRGFAVVSPQPLALGAGVQEHAPGLVRDSDTGSGDPGEPQRATIVTPIVPVLVGDDWKAAMLWRALYDAGVFVNTALHPAVPPGGALLRTSVMATHDEDTLQRALDVFAAVKFEFESEHGPLPAPGEHSSARS